MRTRGLRKIVSSRSLLLVLVVLPVVGSAVTWSLPLTSRELNGFVERSPVTLRALLVLGLWYAAICTVAYFGTALGSRTQLGTMLDDDLRSSQSERRFYSLVSILGIVGVVWSLRVASSSTSIADSLSTGLGNSLSESLNGQAGLATLRYATAISAPVGIYRLLERRGRPWSCLLNVSALLANATFSSRLSLILAALVLAYLVLTSETVKVRAFVVVCLAAIGYIILTLLNFTRNSLYYAAAGVSDPFAANWFQVQTYLSTPWQVSLGVADELARGDYVGGGFGGAPLTLLTPTFFQQKGGPVSYFGPQRYGYNVDINDSLPTNSVFADVVGQYGVAGLGVALCGVAIVSFIFGATREWRSVGRAVAAVAAYAFFEFWRVYLFNQGITVFLIAMVLGSMILARGRKGVAPGFVQHRQSGRP